ncbi:MAG: flagellar hook protein [Phenylobacterium sp.]|nr:flagellar hook protein [Phenylobacterium sp.]
MTTTTSTATATSAATTTSKVNTSGSSAYLTGTASGLDTQSLITAAVAQKTAPADQLDAQVTANKTKIAAYQQLQTLISGLSTSMSQLASSAFSSVATTASAFDQKTVSLTASDSSTASSYLAASAEGTAAAASYTLQVDQLAAGEKVASAAKDQTTPLGLSGSFTLSEASGTASTITVTADMTLQDLASAINAVASASGVSASTVKDSSGGFRLVLSGNDTNQAISATAASGDDVLQSLGLTGSDGAFVTVLQAAQPALVTIDGAQISNDTNDVTDAVSGLSLSLLKTTPTGVSLTLGVTADYSAVKTAITDFITAYNSLRSFVATNQQVGADGSVSSSAPLFADSLLRNASQSVGQLLSTVSPSATGGYGTLGDLGITLDANNNLVLSNETTLDNALLSNLGQVSAMFQSSFTPSDSALKLLQNTSSSSFDFTLDVTADASGAITGASVGGDSSGFTVSGSRIVGVKGGPYDGLSFALAASGDTSIHVAISPGFANQVTSFAALFGDTTSGLIQQQITALTAQDDSWTTQSDKIRSDADAYQTTLVNKYASMEQEVSAAQLVQAQIQALLNGATPA